MALRVLFLDTNHPTLFAQLKAAGLACDTAYTETKQEVLDTIHNYDGIVIRSRFSIDKSFIDAATSLQFIARVGAGLENIDTVYASQQNIQLFSAPEGNRNAVGEHTLGMLLSLFNKLNKADKEVREGKWLREENRGLELDGKTVGIIGYGNMGKSFAKKLRGFDVEVLCYDIKEGLGDANAKQVSLEVFQEKVDVVSLHTPWTPLTNRMIDDSFIKAFQKNFWLLNTARGKSVVTEALVCAIKDGKILGAGLDVLEYEKASFESLFQGEVPEAFAYLLESEKVILSPHVAGWTAESNVKLAQTIVDKILAFTKSKAL